MRQYFAFFREHWPLVSFGFLSIFWGNFGQSFFVSWYGAGIQASLNLTAAAYGSLYSSATLASGLTIMLLGGLIDRVPLVRFSAAAGTGLMLACLLMAASYNPAMLFAGFYLLRLCGQGLLPHSSQTTMARHFEQNRGKALSLAASGVPVGEVILPLIAVALIALIGWRGSWLILAASVPLLYLPAIVWLLRKVPAPITPPAFDSATNIANPSFSRRHMLADYRFWLALPAVLAAPFVVTGIFIQQGFILTAKDWDPLWLASCFIVYGIVHWASSLMAGFLVDLFSARRLLPFMLLPLTAAMLVLALCDGVWVAPVFMALLGCTIGMTGPITGALWAEIYGTGKLGAIRSLMTSIVIISTAAAPVLFGVLIDAAISPERLFLGVAGGAVLASILVVFSYPMSAARV